VRKFPLLVSCLGLILLADLASAQIVPKKNITTEAEAVAEFYRIRRESIRKYDGHFMQESGLTPEQEELFIKTRLDAEDAYRAHLTHTKAAALRIDELWQFQEAALAKAFSPDFAQKYRESLDTRSALEMIVSNPDLKAFEWLTNDEIDQLAKAWSPPLSRISILSMAPEFKTTPPAEKIALYDRYVADLLSAAKPILPEPKYQTLQNYFTTSRPQTIADLEKAEE
jgi:hypothetical protein